MGKAMGEVMGKATRRERQYTRETGHKENSPARGLCFAEGKDAGSCG